MLLTIANLLVLSGCVGKIPIKTILDDPGLHNGKQVQIAGEVTKSPAIPGPDTLEVDDGTGRILVLSKEQGTPPVGTKVVVETEPRKR